MKKIKKDINKGLTNNPKGVIIKVQRKTKRVRNKLDGWHGPDYRGTKTFGGRGNYTMGLKEQLIFSEINYDDVVKVRGMDIVFVTTAKSNEESFDLLNGLGIPFRK